VLLGAFLALSAFVAIAPASGAVTATPCPTSAAYQPDAEIAGQTWAGNFYYLGGGTCNTTAQRQSRTARIAPGDFFSFDVRLFNDGTMPDAILLKGPASKNGFVVHYKTAFGAEDITPAVVAGSYTTGTMSPGEATYFRVRVRAKSTTPVGAHTSFRLLFTSTGDSTAQDAVQANVTTEFPPPAS